MLLKAEDGLTPICHLLTEIPLSAWLWLQGTAHFTAVVVDIFAHFKVKKKKMESKNQTTQFGTSSGVTCIGIESLI